jgi:hypothetical protein
MGWNFSASGKDLEPHHERRLMAELHRLFGDKTYGANETSFEGQHVSGEVQGDNYSGPATSAPVAQEPQRMDPPELQMGNPQTSSLNPAKDPVMPIDDPNPVTPLDAGPSPQAVEAQPDDEAREDPNKIAPMNDTMSPSTDSPLAGQDELTEAQKNTLEENQDLADHSPNLSAGIHPPTEDDLDNSDVEDSNREGSIVGDNPTEEKHESPQAEKHEADPNKPTMLGSEGNPVHVRDDK